MRVVLDTNVVVSALLWHGPPRLLLDACKGESVHAFTSVPLIEELTDTLSQRKFTAKIAASRSSVDELLMHYSSLASLIQPAAIQRWVRDPDDDIVIATAIGAGAELLVTGDRDLLAVSSYDCGRVVSVTSALALIAPVRQASLTLRED